MTADADLRLWVNGRERRYRERVPATLAALLHELGLEAGRVVAELDGRVIPAADFADTPLADGARIELVQFVGGG